MRDYQLAGLNWLIRLYENGINGILADEMVMIEKYKLKTTCSQIGSTWLRYFAAKMVYLCTKKSS